MTKTELKKLVAEVMKESSNKPSYNMNRKDLKSLIKSTIRESDDNEPEYAEYISQMRDEVPFMMGGKKFEYVWAKYPNGKQDIGVYAFAGDVVYGYKHFRKMYNINEATGVVKSELKELIYEVMEESHRETSHVEKLKAIRASLVHRDIAPRFLPDLYKMIDKAIEKEADEVAASLNNKDSNLKENEEVQYVEYVADMSGEVPFMMGTKKFEYVWAKYPNGKRDIGVYAFGEDMVYAYEFFRKMYNIKEDGNKVKNSVRNGKVSDKSSKSEAATKSNNRYDGGVYLPPGLRENNKETFTKKISGTVLVSDMEYDYSANVTVNVVTTRQPHGEDYSEIDEENVDIEIGEIVPEPDETIKDKVNQTIYDKVREMNMQDFVNESNIDTTTIKAAKDWVLDCAVNSEDEANIEDWMKTASDIQVKKYVNRTFDGGWIGFLNSL